MAKTAKTVFECTACGAVSPKWLGRCTACGGWNTLEEVRASSAAARAPAAARGAEVPVALVNIEADAAMRFSTGLSELDRVLGGGAVLGGVTLLGGDPGIGKSTLLMQALAGAAALGKRALYVTAEESAAQVALRAKRLGMAGDVMLLATTELEDVLAALSSSRYDIVVIDSIQTVRSSELESTLGSVGQLREVAARLTEAAKRNGPSVFLIGHVTKDGTLAGPKVLEHLVDTVLAFEGDTTHSFRTLRATKNRFGPSQEFGVFEMVREGLREVQDASAIFIAERPLRVAGSVVVPSTQGTRPMLVEVQALVAPALYGAPRRVTTGLDSNRLAVLLAVLQRKAGVQVLDQDVFANAAGGARIDEPAVDLGLCAAVVSSLRDRALPSDLVVLGEVGLAGEVRAVTRAGARVREASRLGFTRAVLPKADIAHMSDEERSALSLEGVSSLEEALQALF